MSCKYMYSFLRQVPLRVAALPYTMLLWFSNRSLIHNKQSRRDPNIT